MRIRALQGLRGLHRDCREFALVTDPRYRHHLIFDVNYLIEIYTFSQFNGLMHNHPSGDPTPSRADIDMTRTIVETARPMGIAVHDHIVIGRNGHASLKGLQLI